MRGPLPHGSGLFFGYPVLPDTMIIIIGGRAMFSYKTRGTCSSQIDLEITDGIITYCKFTNGCRGNTAGLAKMVIGRKADEVSELLAGIPCHGDTSCPDQLSKAIRAYPEQA